MHLLVDGVIPISLQEKTIRAKSENRSNKMLDFKWT